MLWGQAAFQFWKITLIQLFLVSVADFTILMYFIKSKIRAKTSILNVRSNIRCQNVSMISRISASFVYFVCNSSNNFRDTCYLMSLALLEHYVIRI